MSSLVRKRGRSKTKLNNYDVLRMMSRYFLKAQTVVYSVIMTRQIEVALVVKEVDQKIRICNEKKLLSY